MATQLTLWNATPMVWNDVRLPDAYHAHFKAHGECPNCRMPLRHPMHALNHYKKLHMKTKFRFFVWYFGMWNEVSQAAYDRARKKHIATARSK